MISFLHNQRLIEMSTVTFPPYVPPANAVFNKTTPYSDPLQIEFDANASNTLDKDMWRVTSAFTFNLGLAGDKYKDMWVYVPAGYLTDGASVPRIFWDFIRPWGDYGQAAVVHDILCEYLVILSGNNLCKTITRQHANTILDEAMKALNVPSFVRFVITNSVRLCNFADKIFRGNEGPTATAKKRALEAAWKPHDNVADQTVYTTTAVPPPTT